MKNENWNNIAADPAPGSYYVTATDGPRFWRMLGPFTDHAPALAAVEAVKDYAIAHDRSGKAHFMGWGTVRYETGFGAPGTLNAQLPDLLSLN